MSRAPPSPSSSSPPSWEGFLLKRGSGAIATYAPRFFLLTAECELEYWDVPARCGLPTRCGRRMTAKQLATTEGCVHKGTLPCWSMLGVSCSGTEGDGDGGGDNRFGFRLLTSPGRMYHLRAFCAEDRTALMACLEEACETARRERSENNADEIERIELRSSNAQGGCDYAGALWVGSRGVASGWRQQYITLNGSVVQQFDSEEAAAARKNVKSQWVISAVRTSIDCPKGMHGLIMTTVSHHASGEGPPLHCYSESEPEREAWIRAVTRFSLRTEPEELRRSSSLAASLTSLPGTPPPRSDAGQQPPASPLVMAVKRVIGMLRKEGEETEGSKPAAVVARDSAVVEGYIFKRGRIRKNWKRRFATLDDCVLRYYTSEAFGRAHHGDEAANGTSGPSRNGIAGLKGTVTITGVETVSKLDDSSVPNDGLGFVLDTEDRGKFHVYVLDETDRQRWVCAIQRVLAARTAADSVSPDAVRSTSNGGATPSEATERRFSMEIDIPDIFGSPFGTTSSPGIAAAERRPSAFWEAVEAVCEFFQAENRRASITELLAASASAGFGDDDDDDEGQATPAPEMFEIDDEGSTRWTPQSREERQLVTALGLLQVKVGAQEGCANQLKGLRMAVALSVQDGTPDELRGCLAEPRAVRLVASAMRANLENALFQEKGLKLLANISFGSDEHSWNVVQGGGLATISAALSRHSKCAPVQVKGLWALKNLACTTKIRLRILEECGAGVILTCMNRHLRDASVQEQGLAALCNLAALADARRRMIASTQAPEFAQFRAKIIQICAEADDGTRK